MMDEQPASDEVQRTPASASTSASSNSSSRRSSTVRRTNSRRKNQSLNTVVDGTAENGGGSGTPTSMLRQRSSDLEEEGSLTSFPSLSPEASPHNNRTRKSRDALWAGVGSSGAKSKVKAKSKTKSRDDIQDPEQTPRQSLRMNLVETLMSKGSPTSARGRDALFADSPATTAQDVPGALHHASDDHIRRVVAKRGVVALVRQLASDLAQREAEMTTLRLRAEARERELKRMLREVEVSNLDIERRLHRLEEQDKGVDGKARSNRNSLGSVGDLVDEALGDSLDSKDEETFLTEVTSDDKHATIRASAVANADAESLSSSIDSGKRQGWMNYFLGSSSTVRRARGSSPSGHEPAFKTTTTATSRRKGLDDATFQPPLVLESDTRDSSTSRVDSNASDVVAAKRASKSGWSLKLFAGNSSSPKEGDEAAAYRGRSDSMTASDAAKSLRDASRSSKQTVDSTAAKSRPSKRGSVQAINTGIAVKVDTRSVSGSGLASPGSFEPSSQNLGPVEMDAILPHGSRPPTLSPHMTMDGQADVLTDRFGFIYDQRRRKKEAEAIARSTAADPKRNQETIGNPFEMPTGSDGDSIARSPTPTSVNGNEDAEEGPEGTAQGARRWQDYLKISTFSSLSTELLSQTPLPPSIPVVEPPKSNAKKGLKRVPTYSDESGLTSMNPLPSTSTVSGKAELAKPVLSGPNSPAPPTGPSNDTEPVKLLLEQLGDLHDKLQREKTVRWNEFMRKVRAERRREGENAASNNELRGKNVAELPEAQIADGEIIGIASLGHKGKVGRAKYREFRALVLAGIPVVHRAKIWGECSGANTLRIPGYYQEMIISPEESDPTVVAQIEMDINRTLTDNVFFRNGPGVDKLNEVLLSYARRNPEVGYCQGMNLITASLLLITPTAEDAFWILASLVESILPAHYYDSSLLASRADQQVLRSYVAELLPKLAQHLEDLSVELEALTFQWFLSLFTACLSAEALYRVWDVLICLNQDPANGGSTFLFQVSLALLKLNEQQLLACETPGEVYAYLGGEITNHAISIDGLIRASEGLKALVKRDEVEERRKKWVEIEEETIRERERIRSGAALSKKKAVSTEA